MSRIKLGGRLLQCHANFEWKSCFSVHAIFHSGRIANLSLGGRNFVFPLGGVITHNMAPHGRMLMFSQQLCHFLSSIATEL